MRADPHPPDLGIHSRAGFTGTGSHECSPSYRTCETSQLRTDTSTTLDSIVGVQSPRPMTALTFFVQLACPGVVEPGSTGQTWKHHQGKH